MRSRACQPAAVSIRMSHAHLSRACRPAAPPAFRRRSLWIRGRLSDRIEAIACCYTLLLPRLRAQETSKRRSGHPLLARVSARDRDVSFRRLVEKRLNVDGSFSSSSLRPVAPPRLPIHARDNLPKGPVRRDSIRPRSPVEQVLWRSELAVAVTIIIPSPAAPPSLDPLRHLPLADRLNASIGDSRIEQTSTSSPQPARIAATRAEILA